MGSRCASVMAVSQYVFDLYSLICLDGCLLRMVGCKAWLMGMLALVGDLEKIVTNKGRRGGSRPSQDRPFSIFEKAKVRVDDYYYSPYHSLNPNG